MRLVLVPQHVTTTSAKIWCGIFGSVNQPPNGSVQSGAHTWPLPATAWQVVDVAGRLPADARTIWTQRLTLTSLQPGAAYALGPSINHDMDAAPRSAPRRHRPARAPSRARCPAP